ncbi:hypothetical protein [Nocardia acididurans]|uniref:hypothetical protein n=1 Tax=Nocardia acididurans TaxID=2802282 RepID=UPI001E40AB41|nr:hypothetical protein [Nocardia acididurans]
MSHRFLTDLRVARYRQARAAHRCEITSRAHDLASMRKEVTATRYRHARQDAEAADALLAAVRRKTDA